MNWFEKMIDAAGVYKYVILIGLIGGIIRIVQKEELKQCEKSMKCKIFGLFFSSLVSMFAGYIGFEVAFLFFEKDGISIAIAGLSGWAGTNIIIAGEKKLLRIINGEKDE
ncbi:Uncharacterised protein [Campylobacter hyointestinalis subsp. hyointestinalis]|uniref:Holin n=1 Tax=Campylobacter hyointestinalis subsp. hyointestinalis TaxID=91352 RepID=A0A0S4SA03_CAMHY|nr:phage holin family protein [Campylobacter hyointestinalis]CUU83195.1 Uncharacterised protein [Campylobacter hyointestinalis subsp. hyointestinalis]